MVEQGQVKGTFAILGVAATTVVGVLVGVLVWDRVGTAEISIPGGDPQQVASLPRPVPGKPETPAPAAPPAAEKPAGSQVKEESKPAEPQGQPSFDVVRVEPNGDSVFAGRAAPGATIELLRDGQVHARAVADASGLFALVPPPLPRGSHQIALQSIAPDGVRQRSRDNVTVVISGTERPLVALTAPDKPTVLLSNPEAPEAKPTREASAQPAPSSAPAEAAPGAPRPEIKISSVESEDGGRLYVSAQAASGATVRLYLNESFIAPGGAGADGKVSFAIGRGVKPGDYRVRLDDVDPVSGKVKSRAEVNFNVPVQVAAAQPSASSPSAGVPGPKTPTQAGTATTPGLPANQTASADPASNIVIPDINTALVSRGDSLWRISRRIYGQGYRYTVIYSANQEQIRNPNRIYPGQVFVLPAHQAQN